MEEIRIIETQNGARAVMSKNYNTVFRKTDGFFARWGAQKQDDPDVSPFGPELLDIEVTTACNGVPNRQGICAPCKFCSPAGTLVDTPNGQTPIEQLQVGDKVKAFNGERLVENTVAEVYKHSEAQELINIELADGSTLELTPNHEVFLMDGTTKAAGLLVEGDDVITINEVQL